MFVRQRLPGLWVLGSVVDPLEFEGFDHDIALAIDSRGGTYAPTDPIVIGGDGIELSGANHKVSGTLTVVSLGLVSIASGAEIKAEGSGDADIRLRVVSNVARLEVGSGAVVQVKAGGALDVHGSLTLKQASGPGSLTAEDGTSITLADGSTLTAASGSQVYLNGDTEIGGTVDVVDDAVIAFGAGSQITGAAASLFPVIPAALIDWDGRADFADLRLKGSSWPTLSSARNWERHSLDVAFCTFNNHAGNGPDDPDIWPASSDLSTSMCLRTRTAGNSGDYSVVEFRDLQPGALLTSAKVKTKGVNSTTPEYPTFRVVRWTEGDDFENLSSLTTDIHSTEGSWDTLSRTTTINITGGSHEINKAYRYGVKIDHPYPSGGVGTSSMRVYDVGAYGTVAKIQSN